MDKKQKSRLNMSLAVEACLDRHASLWNTAPALQRRRESLRGKLDLIEAIAEEQERNRTGIVSDKLRIADLLIETMIVVAGQIRAWSLEANDEALRARVRMTRSQLHRLAMIRLPERAKSLRELATEHQEALKDYGLTEALLKQLQNRETAFRAIVIAPRNAIVERNRLTQILDDEIRSVGITLREFFDPLMEQFAGSHPAVLLEYRSARKILEDPVRRRTAENATGTSALETQSETETETETEPGLSARRTEPETPASLNGETPTENAGLPN